MNNIFYVLTGLVIFDILIRIRKRKFSLGRPTFRQSTIHSLIKDSIPSNLYQKEKKPSQSQLHTEKTTIKVIMAPNNKAYWVSQNVFYCADMQDGQFDPTSAMPVDVASMSKVEIEDMLFILDNIRNGKQDDRGSSGNEWFQ